MDIKITLDLSERAHAALLGIAEALRGIVVRGGYLHDECEYKKMRETLSEKCADDALQCTQSAENATEPQTEGELERPAESEAVADATVAAPEPAPKRGRGRPPKKRENLAPVSAISASVDNQAPEAEKSSQDETPCEAVADTPAPVDLEKVTEEPAAPAADPALAEKSDDPYHGMTLMQAVSALMAEVHDTGIELADANARVRKECEARGLPYNSAACLMKELGYDATRKIALGI